MFLFNPENGKVLFLLFSSLVENFKLKYEKVLAEIRRLANDSELGRYWEKDCKGKLQNNWVGMVKSFKNIVNLISQGQYERDAVDIAETLGDFMEYLKDYQVKWYFHTHCWKKHVAKVGHLWGSETYITKCCCISRYTGHIFVLLILL